MASEWPSIPLERLVKPGRPITYGVVKPGAEDPKGVRFVRGGDIADGRIALHQLRTITAEVSNQYKRTLLEGGELLVSLVGNPGAVAIAPASLKGANIARQVGMVCLDSDVDPKYVQYFLASPAGKRALGAQTLGSVQIVINLRDLKRVELPIPDISTQRQIASMLGALDDRIDNLRQTNATLEAVAQALFKSWFVDFYPVHVKAEGREPEGLGAATAALFPSEFEDSELGPIPKGWRSDEIGRAVNCVGGATPSTKDESFWVDGTHHWATPKDLSGLQAPILISTERLITDAAVARISSGLLPAGTLLMSSRAPIGYLAIASVPTAINQGFIAMRPGGQLPPSYLLFWARSNMELIKQKANGSTFMEISKAAFRPIKVCVPSAEVINAFSGVVASLLGRIELNERHKTVLAKTRDTLLPRLISGKLRLPDVETEVEALT